MTQLTDNFNMLSPTGFRLTIEAPTFSNLEYFITTVNLPTVNLPEVSAGYRNYQSFVAGDTLTYDAIDIQFLIDEDMKNYVEVFDWMKSNANDNTSTKYDIILTILSSHNNLNKQIRFVRAIPTSLGGAEFTTQATGIEYLQGTISFRYDYFEIIA
jgi:hypothetical protein